MAFAEEKEEDSKKKEKTERKTRRRTVMEEEMFTCKLTNLALYSPDVLSNAVKVFKMHEKLERLKPTTPC